MISSTIGDKIVETQPSNWVLRRTKHSAPRPPLRSKLGCLLFPVDSSYSIIALLEVMGKESFIFLFIGRQNVRKAL